MGQWNAVGGHKLSSETIEECAIREIYEETNISVQKVELIATFTWNYDDGLGFASTTPETTAPICAEMLISLFYGNSSDFELNASNIE